jgi:hypothetical protein
MHTVALTPTDELYLGEVAVFSGLNFVLSIRNRSHQTLLGVRERAEREPQLLRHGAGFVFYAIVDAVVDRYFPVVDALETELEKIEGRIFEDDTSARANIEALYDLKRELMVVRHAVEPLIEAVHKLYGGRVPQVCQGTQDYFRDVYDHLLRVSTQLDGLRDMVATALQVNISMISLSENAVTKRLAAYGALMSKGTTRRPASISERTSGFIASVTPIPSIAASSASAASLKCGPRVASMSVTPTDCSQSVHEGRAPSSTTVSSCSSVWKRRSSGRRSGCSPLRSLGLHTGT